MLNTSNLPLGGKLFYSLVSLFALIQFLTSTNAYKLNVPKVLLPFHSTKLITFQLEADGDTDPSNHNEDNLCFVWSSSRPDVVTITPIYDSSSKKTSECSNKAIVSAVSKHPQRLTSIILAKETKTDKLIRCDVIVDRIHKIRIKHTTTHLYLEDSPESFTAEALDSESNTFSSLDGLPFEWSVINDVNDNNNNLTLDSRNVLRISKFIESEYQVSESIRQLESIGLSGHKILIEGLKTGTANVQAKLLDSFYKESLKTPLVRLLVVANILIEPSYPVYILVGAYVKYSVFLIKQTNIEKIILPSLQYYFESRNKTTADLADYGLEKGVGDASTIVGLSVGSVEVALIDRNMKEPLFVKTSDQLTNGKF
jgi:nuclear pore complex protein Nup210